MLNIVRRNIVESKPISRYLRSPRIFSREETRSPIPYTGNNRAMKSNTKSNMFFWRQFFSFCFKENNSAPRNLGVHRLGSRILHLSQAFVRYRKILRFFFLLWLIACNGREFTWVIIAVHFEESISPSYCRDT